MTDPRLFILGIDDIDEQHKTIIRLLNEMTNILSADATQRDLACRSHLMQLINYTNTHFAHEEAFMARDGYPGLAAHKRLHTDIIGKLAELGKTIDQPTLALNLNLLLTDWLYDHILNVDGAYARFHNSKR